MAWTRRLPGPARWSTLPGQALNSAWSKSFSTFSPKSVLGFSRPGPELFENTCVTTQGFNKLNESSKLPRQQPETALCRPQTHCALTRGDNS